MGGAGAQGAADAAGRPTPAAAAHVPPSGKRWVSLFAICTAAGVVWLAFADLGVAIPRIADEFDAEFSTLQWANNAFSLVTGALVIAGGKFGDLFGHRRMLNLGIVLMAGFSVLAALSPGAGWLILARGLMGTGAALILPASLALIPPQFAGRAEVAAFGVWQAVSWGGVSVGPALSGFITDGLGWRWLFWINLPLAVVIIAVVRATTSESREPGATRHIDWLGLVTIGLAVFSLLYALTEAPSVGWGNPLIVTLLVATVVLAIGWYLIERRVSQPLVDLRLFRFRPYNGALTANLAMNVTWAGLSFLLVLWLQNALGYSAVEAGSLLLPATVGVFLCIPLGGRLDLRHGGRMPAALGLIVASLGLFVLGALGDRSPLPVLAVGLFVIGLGLGLVSTPVANTAVGEVPVHLAGAAAGVFKMSSMLGGALGVAVLTALARGLTQQQASGVVEESGLTSAQIAEVRQALVNTSDFQQAIRTLPPDLRSKVVDVVTQAFSAGVASSMIATAIIALLASVAVVLLWPREPRGTTPATSSPPGEPGSGSGLDEPGSGSGPAESGSGSGPVDPS